MEQIELAVINLYGGWEGFSEESRQYIQQILLSPLQCCPIQRHGIRTACAFKLSVYFRLFLTGLKASGVAVCLPEIILCQPFRQHPVPE